MNKDLHFSSESNEWGTPKYLFKYLNRYFNFSLDPCCTKETALCKKYFTPKENGLAQSWADQSVFMNPPYGRDIGEWVEKAFNEATKNNATVVCLLPARTDTAWFWNYCRHGYISFLQGRLKFSSSKDKKSSTAPFPSMLVIFYPNKGFMPKPFYNSLFDIDHKKMSRLEFPKKDASVRIACKINKEGSHEIPL